MNAHILLIEADPHWSRILELNLLNSEDDVDFTQTKKCRYCLSIAYDSIEGLTIAREAKPDLILLNMNFSNFSSLEICRRLRSTGNQVPLILIGTKDQVHDCIMGLDAGADDFILHPFAMSELRARIRSRLRRIEMELDSTQLRFEALTLDRATREVYYHQQSIGLTTKEFTLLEYLMIHPRQVMTRDQILNHVWHDNFEIESNILDVYIRYLRLKLEQHHNQRLIHTVRSVGYVLRESLPTQVSSVNLADFATDRSALAG